jgi:N-methylhydantoinase B/oxoprolinase/acetone carboxylase alpha subunit
VSNVSLLGSGATRGSQSTAETGNPGALAVHSHMTNTRLTDPEVLRLGNLHPPALQIA